MNTHRKLLAWQECRRLVVAIYECTTSFPADEKFGLTSQLRRAAVSAAANIAEGYARTGPRETSHGLSIALGSLAEIDTLLVCSDDLGLLQQDRLAVLDQLVQNASKLPYGLLRKLKTA